MDYDIDIDAGLFVEDLGEFRQNLFTLFVRYRLGYTLQEDQGIRTVMAMFSA